MLRQLLLSTACLLGGLSLTAQKPIRVACVGNSVTAGYLLPDPKTQSYPSVLQKLLGDKYEVGNFGHSGATLLSKGHKPYVKTEEYQRAKAFAADVFIIHLGLNDTDPRNWANYSDNFLGDYYNLIDSLTQGDRSKRVLIANMSPITAGHPRFASSTHDWYHEVNAAIRKVAEYRKLELIDYSKPLSDYPHLLPDFLHPDVEGAERLARYAYSCLTGDWGGLQLPPYYGDAMVLQRAKVIELRGRADAGERVRLEVDGRSYIATTDKQGDWSMTIDSLSTDKEHSLTFSTKAKTIRLQRVLVGDVWLASGQSNMAWTLEQTKDHALESQVSDDKLRIYTMQPIATTERRAWTLAELDSVNALCYYRPGIWRTARDPKTLGNTSAVAYHFLRTMRDSLPSIPQAVIVNALGGSPIEAWISQATLERELPAMLINWTKKDYAMPWVRERAGENIALRPKAQRHPYESGYLYAAGIKPLRGLSFKGVLWYQGESNAHNANLYTKLFPLLVADWRASLGGVGGKLLPFYCVQLSSISNRPSWSEFRLTQGELSESSSKHTAYKACFVVPSYDKGDSLDVHPRYKQPIGERLARYALRNEYGHKHAYEATNGLQVKCSKDKKSLVILSQDGRAVRPLSGDKLYGIELAGADGIYHKVVLTESYVGGYSADLPLEGMIYYRYAYAPYTEANLVNSRAIPVMPCRGEIQQAKSEAAKGLGKQSRNPKVAPIRR